MFHLAANLTLLWPELAYADRFAAAAKAGFKYVEVLFPYGDATAVTKAALADHGLELILLNAPAPDSDPRGFAAVTGGEAAFRQDMKVAFACADTLGAKFIHVMTGTAQGVAAQQTLINNLIWASEQAPKGITLTLEPLNPVSMPGYFLNDYALAAAVLTAVGRANVALQYDCFHARMIHGDAVAVLRQYRDLIVHVQIGDAPERGTPGSGDVDFEQVFAALRGTGYSGWVSGEYHPAGRTEATLDWMRY
ncbi:MAG: hydroxypyruvate isomerase [Sulfitobacter sp.]|jgi:hydroxypyruvate isomerase